MRPYCKVYHDHYSGLRMFLYRRERCGQNAHQTSIIKADIQY